MLCHIKPHQPESREFSKNIPRCSDVSFFGCSTITDSKVYYSGDYTLSYSIPKKMLIYSYVNCVVLVLSVSFLSHFKHHSYINHCIIPRFHRWPDAATHQSGAERGRVTWVRCPASAASRPALQPDARGFAQQWNLQ